MTTSMRAETSWPLASTSTTSTSKMEHATCSTSHNRDYLHLPSLMVQHLHSQSGLGNFVPTSTSASSSTSTSWISPTMRKYLLQQTSWFYKQKLVHNNMQRWRASGLHVKNFKMNVHYLKQSMSSTSTSSIRRYNSSTTTSMHNNYFKMQ